MNRIITVGLSLVFAAAFILPGTAVAVSDSSVSSGKSIQQYSIAELEALIAKLTKQLEELKKGTPCFVSEATLSLGDGDDVSVSKDVVRLQEFLREKGFFTYAKSTGFFGKVTRTALLSFQASVGVPATGEFDAATRAKAHAMTCQSKSLNVSTVKKEDKKVEKKPEDSVKVSAVSSITLSANGAVLSWTTVGTPAQGFKVVWSKTAQPTYPLRGSDKYLYFTEPSTSQATVTAFDGAGTYYARVCEYLGGKCGTYSNEVAISL